MSTTTAERPPPDQPSSGDTRPRPRGQEPRTPRPVALPTDLLLAVLRGLAVAVLALAVFVCLVGPLVQARDQDVLYSRLRTELAQAVAPTSAGTPLGDPVAVLEVPAVGLRQVVVEGTDSTRLRRGPGHRPDSVLPGQVGVSIVAGRSLTWGAPFRRLGELRAGDALTVVTGQGRFGYRVIGVRRDGSPLPAPPATGASRITLVSAVGSPIPSRALYVDADLVTGTPAAPAARRAATASERSFGSDPSVLYPLVLQLQALGLLVAAVVWFTRRVGRWQAWLVGVPTLGAWGAVVLTTASGLLPNLI